LPVGAAVGRPETAVNDRGYNLQAQLQNPTNCRVPASISCTLPALDS